MFRFLIIRQLSAALFPGKAFPITGIHFSELTYCQLTFISLYACPQLFQHSFAYPVICIHKSDVLAGCFLQPQISGRGNPSVFFLKEADSGILFTPFLADSCAAVLGTVINKKNLQILIGLADNAFQTVGNIFFCIINRYNHRNLICHLDNSSQYAAMRLSQSNLFTLA